MATTKQRDGEATSFLRGCISGLALLVVLTLGFLYLMTK